MRRDDKRKDSSLDGTKGVCSIMCKEIDRLYDGKI